jgi:hypothetical protein
MEREGDEVHVTTTEARSGSRGRHARNILLLSLLLVIVALSATWIFGAMNSPQGSHEAPISNQAPPTPGP